MLDYFAPSPSSDWSALLGVVCVAVSTKDNPTNAMETCSHCGPVNAYHLQRWISPSPLDISSNTFRALHQPAPLSSSQFNSSYFRVACHCHGGDSSFMSFELCLSAAAVRQDVPQDVLEKLTSALGGSIFAGLFSQADA